MNKRIARRVGLWYTALQRIVVFIFCSNRSHASLQDEQSARTLVVLDVDGVRLCPHAARRR